MYSSSDDSTYESDYKSGYNSDNSGQSSLHGKRRVWDDLRDVKAEPPEFYEGTNPDNFIKWLNDTENIFEVKGYSDEKSYKFAVLKFKKYASLWWKNVCKLASKIEKGIKVKKVDKSAPKLIQKEKCPNRRVMTLREVQEVTLVEEDEEKKPIYDESFFEERVSLDEGVLLVIRRALLLFSIDKSYQDQVLYDVIPMDACHILLSRPCPVDRQVMHDGHQSVYSFIVDKKKIILGPLPLNEGKEPMHPAVGPLLAEFTEVFPTNLPLGLSPLRGIEHQIDLIPRAPLPNKPTYRCDPEKTKELQRKV
nr:hypothetical protein [Tanacetum cinerariifolium]